jgi:hypothetical protein
MQVVVHGSLFNQDMLRELWRIVVEKATEGIYRLGNRCSEERVLFRQIFRKSDEAVESARLSGIGQNGEGQAWLAATGLEGGNIELGESKSLDLVRESWMQFVQRGLGIAVVGDGD